MTKVDNEFKVGSLVKRKGIIHSYKIIGLSDGGNLLFLIPIEFEDRPFQEHAIQCPRDELVLKI